MSAKEKHYTYEFELPEARSGSIQSFDGITGWTEDSTAQTFWDACLLAAKKAATTLQEQGETLPQMFRLSDVRFVVGNPNIKCVRVTLTQEPNDQLDFLPSADRNGDGV